MKIIKNKGILFWITGLPGSGKTSIAKLLKKDIEKKIGPTLILSGDDVRKMFNLNSYSHNDRKKYVKMYHKICKNIVNQNINIIFAVVGLFDFIRKQNRSNIKNYIEIFMDAKLNKIIKNKKKKRVYMQKKNIVGVDIKVEFPKKPDIIIKNNFDRGINEMKKELLNKLDKLKLY